MSEPPSQSRPALEPKPPSASRARTVQIVFPNDVNPHDNVFGGRVVQWVDLVAAMAAQRHTRSVVVTASIDALAFKAPIYLGEYAVLNACVNRAWHTSMEVQVTVDAEDPLTGDQRRTVEAFLTFVAVDADGQPTAVPPISPETADERTRYEAAEARRQARLARR